jgi:hypothetical protein
MQGSKRHGSWSSAPDSGWIAGFLYISQLQGHYARHGSHPCEMDHYTSRSSDQWSSLCEGHSLHRRNSYPLYPSTHNEMKQTMRSNEVQKVRGKGKKRDPTQKAARIESFKTGWKWRYFTRKIVILSHPWFGSGFDSLDRPCPSGAGVGQARHKRKSIERPLESVKSSPPIKGAAR